MNKAMAAEILSEWVGMAQTDVNKCVVSFDAGMDEVDEALDMAVAALEGRSDGDG